MSIPSRPLSTSLSIRERLRTVVKATVLMAALWFTLTNVDLAGAQELSGVKMRTCGPKVCSLLDTESLSRSNFSLNLMAFGEAALEVSSPKDPNKITQRFVGEDGYYDMQSQVIVLRNLKNSLHKELVFSLVDGKFIYF